MDILFPDIIRVPGLGSNGIGSFCEGGPTGLAPIPLFTVLIYAELDNLFTGTLPAFGNPLTRLVIGLIGYSQHIQQRVGNFLEFLITQALSSLQNLSNLIHANPSIVIVFCTYIIANWQQ